MRGRFLTRTRSLDFALVMTDGVLIIGSLIIVYGLLISSGVIDYSIPEVAKKISSVSWILVVSQVAVLYVLGLYSAPAASLHWRYGAMIFTAVVLATGITAGVLFFIPDYILGRRPLLLNVPVLFALLWLSRHLVFRLVRTTSPPKKLAIIGGAEDVKHLCHVFRDQELPEYEIATICCKSDHGGAKPLLPLETCNRVKWQDDALSLLLDEDFDAIALDTTDLELDREVYRKLIELSLQGIELRDLNDLYKTLSGRIPPQEIRSKMLVRTISNRGVPGKHYWRLKRLMDIVVSATALVASSWIMFVIAVAIRIDSPGPVIFVQERLGYKRRPFGCMKFRTMVQDAERQTGPVWATEEDPRITRIGKFLRQTRLDELPQFINVLKGEMALVGPRPIREHFADILAKQIPLYDTRFTMRPGLTGWAQVSYHYAGSEAEQETKFRYDMYYLENYDLVFDILIILRTSQAVLKRVGL